MRERWLQTMWGCQDWNGWPLRTCQGQMIHVLYPGKWNTDQGPDFLEAQIFIDQILWVGSVEIHIQGIDWFRHHHSTDPNYLPVILHVVWMQGPRSPDIPTLELARFLHVPELKRTLSYLGDLDQLNCHRVMRPVPEEVWSEWKNALLSARLARKKKMLVGASLTVIRNQLARQMGAWVNRDVFESIDASISEQVLEVVRPDLATLTALYLGQAGLLVGDRSEDELDALRDLYKLLQNRYQLYPPFRSLLWMRIRPAAHPGFRLSQLASLIHAGWHDPMYWLHRSADDLYQLLVSLPANSCRETDRKQYLSDQLIGSLLINIWAYLTSVDAPDLYEKLQTLGFENNRFTSLFDELHLTEHTAADSQAMLELYHSLCQHRRCDSCALAGYWRQDQAPQSI